MMLQASDWSNKAIHDTVAAIASQAKYRRSPTSTLWSEVIQWVMDRINEFYRFFAGSGVGRTVVYILAAILVLVMVARIFIAYRDERMLKSRTLVRRDGRSVIDYLKEAERFAAAGNYTAAGHALFAALLDTLAARGEVRVHSSKTTGDYHRELRRKQSASAPKFQQFRSIYDRLVYRDARIDEQHYRALYEAAIPLLDRKAA